MQLDDSTRKRMSAFVSNFTEIEMFEIKNSARMKYGDFVYFGVMHNYLNNRKFVKKTSDGKLTVDGRQTFAAVEKYFGLETDPGDERASATYKGKKFEYKNKVFVFDIPEERIIWRVSVDSAYDEDGVILMKGLIYNKDDMSRERGDFWAYAEKTDRGGEEEWTLISLHEGEHDGSPFGSDMSGASDGL
jgi:hypothetical protein